MSRIARLPAFVVLTVLAQQAAVAQQNVDTIITGHTPVLTWNELRAYAEFNRDFVSGARDQIKAGKPAGQAATEYRVPAEYKGYTVSPNPQFGDAKANTQIVYKELQK